MLEKNMEILTNFQKKILKQLGRSEIGKFFFFTGGSALSAFYLKHRFSEDLDFFTTDSKAIQIVKTQISNILKKVDAQADFRREYSTFIECWAINLEKQNELVKMDFAVDSPYRLSPIQLRDEFNIYVDSLLDISCNKFSALFDRHDAKDFVDIYFLHKEYLSFDKIYENARKKHIGIERHWLAQSLFEIRKIEKLPKMIKKVTIKELKEFFLKKAEELICEFDSEK
ncbi:MAG: nucleotidyl transferase AbiEii/AbiGii toxin family protein [Candidatus Cloacimonetes bacterium]|nr:nucleotidyl transferase AbiEii/AbiGii toxin family protein [Candidatus Cloacimonadota bacterium]